MRTILKDLFERDLSRKEFLDALAQYGFLALGFLSPLCPLDSYAWFGLGKDVQGSKSCLVEALYYKKLEGKGVQCLLCPHKCLVRPGERGRCRVRENRDGTYYAITYGKPCAIHVDPVEKKPLFHVLPGERAFSLATAGCNLNCLFCQNWQISQARPEEVPYEDIGPDEIIDRANAKECKLIAFTYSEPTIFFEYMLDIAKKAHGAGLINTYHSNGYINPDPLNELCKVLDAANVDLKGFTEEYYRDICGGDLKSVLCSLKGLKKQGVHLEITTLIVPTKNDKLDKIREMARWIKDELGHDTPLHFSRFYPQYKLQNLPPTPVDILERARDAAMEEGIDFVYIGNLRPGHDAENTYCPQCKKMLIERRGYSVIRIELKDGKCRYCGRKLPGLWG